MTARLLAAALAALMAFPAPAQDPKRYAVVVGINTYQHSGLPKLNYAEADATDLEKLLKGNKYEVELLTGDLATGAIIRGTIKKVSDTCKAGDLVLIAFAGHGLQFDRQKTAYFCPVDARPFPENADTLVSMDEVYDQLKRSFAATKVLLVDACRNDPDKNRSGVDSASRPQPTDGVAALYSCKAGERAFENDRLKHGVFFNYVLEGLRGDARDLDGCVTFNTLYGYVMPKVHRYVEDELHRKQSPHLVANYTTEPILAKVAAPDPKTALNRLAPKTVEPLELDLGGGVKLILVPITKGSFIMGANQGERFDPTTYTDEQPPHNVTLKNPFFLGQTEVTIGQFRRFVAETKHVTDAERTKGHGYNAVKKTWEDGPYTWEKPGYPVTDDHPVANVSWDDARAFCEWLSKKSGRTVRLPREAEWEYCARARSAKRYYCGENPDLLAAYGNVADEALREVFADKTEKAKEDEKPIRGRDGFPFTAPVRKFLPNAFALYDMIGNVSEWCEDCKRKYDKNPQTDPIGRPDPQDRRIARGGSYASTPPHCRSAFRGFLNARTYCNDTIGFRVLVEQEPSR